MIPASIWPSLLLVLFILANSAHAQAVAPSENVPKSRDLPKTNPTPSTRVEAKPTSGRESPKDSVNSVDGNRSLLAVSTAVVPQAGPVQKPIEVYDAAFDIWHKVGGDVLLGLMDVQVTAANLDPMVAESLSAVLAAELATASRNRYQVISRNELHRILVQQVEAQQLGCVEPSCLADLGKLAAADFIVTGTIGEMGEEWVFSLELIDVRVSQVLRRQALTWQGSAAGLIEVCRPMVLRLIDGSAAAQYRGGLQILSNEAGAVVHVDDEAIGETPIELYPNLPIGRHRIKINKPGYLHYTTDVVVHRNETTLLQAQLVDEGSLQPWYRKWWVWTGAAALVAGSVTAAAMLHNPDTTAEFEN